MTILYKKQSPIPKLLQKKNIFLYGHRGLSKHRLENTLSSFQYAVNCKMDGIELDIQKTKDNEIIVFHDESLEKINGNITPMTKMNFNDIKKINLLSNYGTTKAQYIPKLTDVIKMIPKNMVLNIEIKSYNIMKGGIEKNIVYLFDKYDLYENTIISSFNPFILSKIKKMNPQIPIALIWNGKTKFIKCWTKYLNPSTFHINIDFINHSIIRWMNLNNIKVYAYTVNEEKNFKRAKKYGLDGIFTDVNLFNNMF